MYQEQDLALPDAVEDLVAAYQSGLKKMESGFAILTEAHKEMTAVIDPKHDYSFNPVEDYSGPSKSMEALKKEWDRKMWGIIVDRTGIKKVMSIKAQKKLDNELHGDRRYGNGQKTELPEITVESVYAFINGFTQNAGDLMLEAIKEVSQVLRPSSNWYSYKTNDPFKIGPKVILTWMIEHNGWSDKPFRVRYASEDKLRAMDRVFYLLDGKGIPEGYKSPLIDAINTADDGKGQTEYFEFKTFHNGNLHLKFRRTDLVDELNRIAADHTSLGMDN